MRVADKMDMKTDKFIVTDSSDEDDEDDDDDEGDEGGRSRASSRHTKKCIQCDTVHTGRWHEDGIGMTCDKCHEDNDRVRKREEAAKAAEKRSKVVVHMGAASSNAQVATSSNAQVATSSTASKRK